MAEYVVYKEFPFGPRYLGGRPGDFPVVWVKDPDTAQRIREPRHADGYGGAVAVEVEPI